MNFTFKISKLKTNVLLVFVVAFLFGSCKKVGCTDEYAVNYDSQAEKSLNSYCIYQDPVYEPYIPDFGPNTATLMVDKAGIETIYGKFNIMKSNYYLRAQFKDANNNLVSAGDLEMKQYIFMSQLSFKSLEENNNHFYSHYAALNNTEVLLYMPDTMTWRAQGDVWPSFLLDNPIDSLPSRSFVMSGTPSISSAYIFQTSMVGDADSLSLAIHGQRGSVVKVIAGNQTQAVFSKEELEKVGLGNAVLRVMAMQYEEVNEDGKSYYFVNASRTSSGVRIQP